MPAANFRLTQILSAGASNTWLSLNYDQYQHNGLLKHLSDTGPKGANNAMDNTATFTYDGLGRLRGVEGQQGLPPTSPGLRSQGWLAWLTRLGAFSRYSRSCKRWRTQ
ncbi:MAG: hypothetical protein HY699_07050 [Deltaproteobacteria bacterium]|nr:hypothetical protein [Deltaproteobacteria bacterium]